MTSAILILMVLIVQLSGFNTFGSDDAGHSHEHNQDHEKEEKGHHDPKSKDQEHKHSDEDEHDHPDEHDKDEDHKSEASSAVGPDKGIVEKNEKGFKLSPEAYKAFDFKVENLTGKIFTLPRLALVEIKNDKFIYRVRQGWIKRLQIKVLKKDKQKLTVELSQYQEGDQVIVNAVGFIRTAEMVAEEGVSHGHSH